MKDEPPYDVKAAVRALQADVLRLTMMLETALMWMAQSANSPLSQREVKDLIEKVGRP